MTILKSLLAVVCLLPAIPQERHVTREQRLTFDAGVSLLTVNFARSIAADGEGRVHIVWYDNRDGVTQIYYKRSLDHGRTWGADVRLAACSIRQEHPAIAVRGDTMTN